MLRRLSLKKRGQSSVEYAVLIIIAIGVFLAISTYFKRAIQGRWKESVDDMGDQYDPFTSDSVVRHTLIQNQLTVIKVFNAEGGLWTRRKDTTSTIEKKEGFIVIGDSFN